MRSVRVTTRETGTVCGTARRPHFSLAIISVTVQLRIQVFWVISVYFNVRNIFPKSGTFPPGHPVLQSLTTPSSFPTPLPSIAPFAYPKIAFTHSCIYPIFPGSSVMTSFFHPLCFQLIIISDNRVQFLPSTCPYQMSCFSSCVIQYRILSVHFKFA